MGNCSKHLCKSPSKNDSLGNLLRLMIVARLVIVGGVAGMIAVSMLAPSFAKATVTKVGNGDDGGDLEGGRLVTSGILIETRSKALARMRALGVASVENLGTLLPEIEKSDLYLVSRDVAPKLAEDEGMESADKGKAIYARTFAEPHAATRFFPVALTLNEEQLIALHVHEALHRALPAHVREDEKKVTKITLALVSPDASLDRVRRVVAAEIKPHAKSGGARGGKNASSGPDGAMNTSEKTTVHQSLTDRPSSVTYQYRSFFAPEDGVANYPVDTLHSLSSLLYPFAADAHALGFGLELTYVKTPDRSFMGPLSLSASGRLLSLRGFDIGVFASHALHTTSSDEIKNSPLGRDITTIGLNMRRDTHVYYVENTLTYSLAGEASQTIGGIEETHSYGPITSASMRTGLKPPGLLRGFEFGGFAELIMGARHQVRSGNTLTDSGRHRILGAGPEFTYTRDDLKFSLNARWIIDSTPGVSLDDLGDLMGYGSGQGFVSTAVTLSF